MIRTGTSDHMGQWWNAEDKFRAFGTLRNATPEPRIRRDRMITLNKLDAFDADRLHRKLNRMWRACDERLARRRYRIMYRVYLHLHRTLLVSA